MKPVLMVVSLAALTTLAACTTQDSPTVKPSPIACSDPRPEMCTMEYRPVCATRDTGVRCVTTPCPSTDERTYSNACSACADAAVLSYVPDECPGDAAQ